MRERHGVPPVDIYAVFGKPDPSRICLECETLGHICRSCRAERYYARLAAEQEPPRWSFRTWWRSTTFYAMNRDYPVAAPLVFAAGTWWASLALIVIEWAIGR